MAGRRDRLERIAAPGDDLAVVERAVGRIGGIMRGVEAARRAVGAGRRPVGAGADDRRAGRRAERRRRRRMVAMGMGDEDVADAPSLRRAQQRFDMRRVDRAGIDDRHLLAADDVTAGPGRGEGRGIVGDDPSHQRRDLGRLAGRRLDRPLEDEFVVRCPGHRRLAHRFRVGVGPAALFAAVGSSIG